MSVTFISVLFFLFFPLPLPCSLSRIMEQVQIITIVNLYPEKLVPRLLSSLKKYINYKEPLENKDTSFLNVKINQNL